MPDALQLARWLSSLWKRDELAGLLAHFTPEAAAADSFALSWERREQFPEIERWMLADMENYLEGDILTKVDRASMAVGLEARSPFLDHKLVEYLMGLPDEVKRSNGTPKRLLVESLDDLLPTEIVQRPKQGFALPFDSWMRGALRKFCETRLFSKRIAKRGIFNLDEVKRLWQAFLNGSPSVSWSRLRGLRSWEEGLKEPHRDQRCL